MIIFFFYAQIAFESVHSLLALGAFFRRTETRQENGRLHHELAGERIA
jgi:hypothetical protein